MSIMPAQSLSKQLNIGGRKVREKIKGAGRAVRSSILFINIYIHIFFNRYVSFRGNKKFMYIVSRCVYRMKMVQARYFADHWVD